MCYAWRHDAGLSRGIKNRTSNKFDFGDTGLIHLKEKNSINNLMKKIY